MLQRCSNAREVLCAIASDITSRTLLATRLFCSSAKQIQQVTFFCPMSTQGNSDAGQGNKHIAETQTNKLSCSP